jgi:hypothetical protein
MLIGLSAITPSPTPTLHTPLLSFLEPTLLLILPPRDAFGGPILADFASVHAKYAPSPLNPFWDYRVEGFILGPAIEIVRRWGALKIMDVVTLQSCGTYAVSRHWKKTRKQIHDAVKRCERPEFVSFLKTKGWAMDRRSRNAFDRALGYFDAVLPGPEKPVVVEWEAGDVSSSHYSMNKLTMFVSSGIISAGVLVVSSRRFYVRSGDRAGNFRELDAYLGLWKSVPCGAGVLELIVVT